ncbi:hypothetical protein [Acinetobacter bereziniae]|uniref:Uncharacterized protein n=1 Tax=Acinetobacter bereziniae NIPH 3 TaxID=1217651 RepID=N8YL01_ACIBZ|nr:hypothetical protein [Acinetobacter bereziniae]ENV19935.1 hypothetical protein F963_03980 [Acinetobacter bereziniae NIPH 3]
MDIIYSIRANIIGSRNILLNGRKNEHIIDCLQYVIDNSSFVPVESTRRILDFCLKEVLLQVHSSDFRSAGMILNLIHNLPLDKEKEEVWDVDYFLSSELITFLRNYKTIISAKKIAFFVCGELSLKYVE